MNKILITGGMGFIGSNLVRECVQNGFTILNFDNFGIGSNKKNVSSIERHENYFFKKGDLRNKKDLDHAIEEFKPSCIIHLAAESHVDRSIAGPESFINSNIVGTFNLLQSAYEYWKRSGKNRGFRFLHISTDEVFGHLGDEGKFSEKSLYNPRSPYAASKAASDHLVSAWYNTYDLPTIITNCSNNYGPHQFPEKLIPKAILNAVDGLKIPIYGDGNNIRDWLFVDDHIRAILLVIKKGVVGSSYNIGGDGEITNRQLIVKICNILDKKLPSKNKYSNQIKFVSDRPGHDYRYAVNSDKLKTELGWVPEINLQRGLDFTIDWYLRNRGWFD